MSAEEMRRYLAEVGMHLSDRGLTGEIVLAGGAVMVMALHARGGSRDIDAVFATEADAIREAVGHVAAANGLPAFWLNDHERVFIAADAPTVELFEAPGLGVRMVRLDRSRACSNDDAVRSPDHRRHDGQDRGGR